MSKREKVAPLPIPIPPRFDRDAASRKLADIINKSISPIQVSDCPPTGEALRSIKSKAVELAWGLKSIAFQDGPNSIRIQMGPVDIEDGRLYDLAQKTIALCDKPDEAKLHAIADELLAGVSVPTPKTEAEALRVLGTQPSWRLNELEAAGVTESFLRRLDESGYVEVRPWQLWNLTTDPNNPKPPVPGASAVGWVSPVSKPILAGRWSDLCNKQNHQPGCSPEIRLTEKGRAALDRVPEAGADEAGAGPAKGKGKPGTNGGLPDRVTAARDQYLKACEGLSTDTPRDREAYHWLENTIAEAKARNRPEPFVLDIFDTWTSYLRIWRRKTGQSKHTSRSGRKTAINQERTK